MTVEYKYVNVDLTEEQRHMVDLGMVKLESVNDTIMALINEESSDGWEPMYPFMFPCLWFKRDKKRRVVRKTIAKRSDTKE